MAVSSTVCNTITPKPQPVHNFNSKPCLPTNKKLLGKVLDVSLGLVAASVVALTPLDASATRIEYFATVAEPSCELNFANSGLGYCDVAVGPGVEAPFAELVNGSVKSSNFWMKVVLEIWGFTHVLKRPSTNFGLKIKWCALNILSRFCMRWKDLFPYFKTIHYTARFADGIIFDSSYKRARPLTMRLGMGKVIKGLDQGILGGEGVPPMKVGGKRRLQIPPQLAYGPEPAGCFSGDCNIPANATLIYDINFVEIYSGNRK